jgi:hypothetical protein
LPAVAATDGAAAAGSGLDDVRFVAEDQRLDGSPDGLVSRFEFPSYTADGAIALAHALGFPGDGEKYEYTGFSQWEFQQGARSLHVSTDGMVEYDNRTTASPRDLDRAMAVKIADQWLNDTRLRPADTSASPDVETLPDGSAEVTYIAESAHYARVANGPFPALIVDVGRDAIVHSFFRRWPERYTTSSYPLMTASSELVAALNAGRGTLTVDGVDDAPATRLKGTARIDSIDQAFVLLRGEDRGEAFVAPGYLVKGTLTLDDGRSFNFAAVVDAVDHNFVEE